MEHDEPTNEELGIEPAHGWRLAGVWIVSALLSGVAFGLLLAWVAG